MTPTVFAEQTAVAGKGQPEYSQLPCHQVVGDPQGRVVFCWTLSWKERLRVLLSGKLWHQVLTFRQPLQPQMLGVEKPTMLHPAIRWNEGNLVVQDHRDGTIYEEATEFERSVRGLPRFSRKQP